ncbi:hypothetical protein EJB05_00727, partial [Eragrostis curvula]
MARQHHCEPTEPANDPGRSKRSKLNQESKITCLVEADARRRGAGGGVVAGYAPPPGRDGGPRGRARRRDGEAEARRRGDGGGGGATARRRGGGVTERRRRDGEDGRGDLADGDAAARFGGGRRGPGRWRLVSRVLLQRVPGSGSTKLRVPGRFQGAAAVSLTV